jgi:lipid-A-disaccharide synthase
MTGERDGSGRPWVSVVMRQTHDALAHCVAAVVCSGTATLEAAILGVPMVIIYRGSRLMAVEYAMRRIARIEHIGLPNIVAGRRIVPELVADGATADAMAAHVLRYIEEPGLADAARRNLDEVRRLLGEPGAARRTAEMVLHMVGGRAGDRSATGVRA